VIKLVVVLTMTFIAAWGGLACFWTDWFLESGRRSAREHWFTWLLQRRLYESRFARIQTRFTGALSLLIALVLLCLLLGGHID
jgi:hypothetical protein